MAFRSHPIRCSDCRRRFGGAYVYERHQDRAGRCLSAAELRMAGFRYVAGVWRQRGFSRNRVMQVRLFKLGRKPKPKQPCLAQPEQHARPARSPSAQRTLFFGRVAAFLILAATVWFVFPAIQDLTAQPAARQCSFDWYHGERRDPSTEAVFRIVRCWAVNHGVDDDHAVDTVDCESSGYPYAVNGVHKGPWQYKPKTWASWWGTVRTWAGKKKLHHAPRRYVRATPDSPWVGDRRMDPWASSNTATFQIRHEGWGAWAGCA